MEQRMKSVLGALSVDVHQLGYGYKRLWEEYEASIEGCTHQVVWLWGIGRNSKMILFVWQEAEV
jgi:hypothetical protein